ncbi:MAG TPA: DUF4148 domain-containing protein [Burkholderiaceae bacterium]|nr:DUF4148 domain-containing protein [Burkholderiaceae bacterium]
MNTKNIVAAIALTLGTTASFAENPAWGTNQIDTTPSTLSREEVRAEFERAKAAGELFGIAQAYGVPTAASQRQQGTGLTREQVQAELARAKAAGELDIARLAYGVKGPSSVESSPKLVTVPAAASAQ